MKMRNMTDDKTIQRLMASAAGTQWQKIGNQEHHGIAVPLFSLHTKNSCGIGEYPDLIPLIDWCKEIGFDVIQLLPLNDNGLETSPYCALSAHALNPLHLGLSQLPNIKSVSELQSLTRSSQRVDYKTIQKKKDEFLQKYYRQYGQETTSQESYQAFKEQNKAWLADYALFKVLKIRQEWQSWEGWAPIYKDPTPAFTKELPADITAEAEYHCFLQYLCFKQFEAVKQHAEKNKIFLKGDIPILINRESADVWCNRPLFLMQLAAGAPPDMYAKDGQKWGFPLYNWDVIASQNYRWWTARLAVSTNLYHIYRIDHIVGFFRIWGIPLSRPARDGHFFPEDENLWIPHGQAIMKVMLESCPMLPIGEDLGVVPPSVRQCLRSLGICGTKVMRWERRWEEDKGYIDPKDYPAESMTTVSTHDSETLELWWKNQTEEAQLYAKTLGWTYDPQITQEQRFAILRASHQSNSLFHINLLQEYLALIPNMTWPNPEDERINIPGTISDKNWSYRFRPPLEEITVNADLKQKMADILHK